MITLVKSPVRYQAEDHTYWLGEKQLSGITQTLIRRAFPDKYSGIDEATLKEAARKGTELHEAIAFYDRFGGETDNVRVNNYIRIKEENGLKAIENEYLISDNDRYASMVDIVCENKKGEVVLIDTKTTYTLDRLSVSLQLSVYKRLFELQNPGIVVAHIYALWLPNRDETIAELVELTAFDNDVLDALYKAEAEDKPFVLNPLPEEYPELEVQLRKWQAVKDEADAALDEIREKIITLMIEHKLTQIKSAYYTCSFIPSKVGTKFDSTAFKKENPELYKQYQKPSETKASIRLLKTN